MVARTQPRHRHSDDTLAGKAQRIEGCHGDKECQRRVKATRDTEDGMTRPDEAQAL